MRNKLRSWVLVRHLHVPAKNSLCYSYPYFKTPYQFQYRKLAFSVQEYFDRLSRLKIVTMILYEVLRLYPPVIFLNRRTCKEMELGGIKYPAGVNLLLPVLSIHRDPTIWGKDANEFNPERFSEGISNATKYHTAFFPFGWGPRICIGQNFALLEAKMALCTILQRFSFELSPSYTHAPYTVITLHPEHGAQVKLKNL
ncbi:cytochrome P450 72A14-like [Panicum virgatum]|uniref:cytochrome P450 72A14-like n=1 Tax=Panicum virgatum TaxID=38727 RepID=UPI0019D6829D|nr:cytochrome P450 72A14-like [Panicum virgatum]